MNYKLFIFLLTIVFFSCEKEKIVTSESILNCIGDNPVELRSCEDNEENEYFCEVEFVGEFDLEDSSKAYMVHYCKEIDEAIIYENDEGETKRLVIKEKNYLKANGTFNTLQPCENDSSKWIGYCINNERVSISLESLDSELDLIIEISTIPDVVDPVIGQIGDILEISRKKDSNSRTIEFGVIINQRTLSYDKRYDQEYFESIEIRRNL